MRPHSADTDTGIPRRSFLATCAAGLAAMTPALPFAFPTSEQPAPPLQPADLTDDNIVYASATTLAEAIRTKRVSSVELVDAYYRRIAQVNPKINALVLSTTELAHQEALAADAALAKGKILGPLHGVPFTAKDSHEVAGVISTAGTTGWAKRVPTKDGTAIGRIRAAGAVLLGRTNTPEFTLADETDNLVYGRTNNPWNLARTTGGSSGGAAALVAVGGTPFDIGSDTGNSIRYPSHNCGVAGLKPTAGRVPRTGHAIDYTGVIESWTQLGPIARYVEDLDLILPIINGVDWIDPHVAPVPLLRSKDVTVGKLRVAYYTDNGMVTPTPETVTAVKAAVAAVAATGAHVQERLFDGMNDAVQVWDDLWPSDGCASFKRLLANAGTPGHGSLPWLDTCKPVPVGEFTRLVERIDQLRSQLLTQMKDYDVIICPVEAVPAVAHGATLLPSWRDTYCPQYNVLGWPGAVVRGGTSPEGLPIGVQIVGQPWRDDLALAVAAHLQTALGGWKRPPI
jgi:amidase